MITFDALIALAARLNTDDAGYLAWVAQAPLDEARAALRALRAQRRYGGPPVLLDDAALRERLGVAL